MWIYFNQSGTVAQQLIHGTPARQGSAGVFTINCVFEGIDLTIYNTATVNFLNPDGTANPTTYYMDLFGNKKFDRLSSEVGVIYPFVDGARYNGFTFTVNDSGIFSQSGMYQLTVKLYNGQGTIAVQGVVSVSVQASTTVDPTITRTEYENLLTELGKKLGLNPLITSGGLTYIKIIQTEMGVTVLDSNKFREGDIVYIADTKLFKKAVLVSNQLILSSAFTVDASTVGKSYVDDNFANDVNVIAEADENTFDITVSLLKKDGTDLNNDTVELPYASSLSPGVIKSADYTRIQNALLKNDTELEEEIDIQTNEDISLTSTGSDIELNAAGDVKIAYLKLLNNANANNKKIYNVAEPTNPSDAATKNYVDTKVVNIYRYGGSVATYNDLPTNITETGIVYDTRDTGMNYASVYNSQLTPPLHWDELGTIISISEFIKKDGSVAMTGNLNLGGHNVNNANEINATQVNVSVISSDSAIDVQQDLDLGAATRIINLPNATSNDEAVNLGQMNTALASYRTSANQDVIDQEIRELANGRTATYGLSYSSTIAKLKQALSNGFISKVYDSNDTDITQAVINGDYDSVSLVNSIFNDNDLRIYTTTAEGNWLLLGYIDVSQPVSVPTTTKLDTIANFKLKWKTNDEINVYERLVPDRWINIGAGNVIEFFANETKTVDLTNVAKKNETNTFSAVQTFSSGVNTEVINTSSTGSGNIYFRKDGSTLFYITANAFIPNGNQDIGSSSKLAKDLYLSGIITDGTYSTTPANIYGNITTTSADSVSTTFSGSLTSNTDYKLSVLTSIAISSLIYKPNDQAPSWKIGFTVGTGLTCTLPSGCSWAGGTPDFTTMVGEYHFILIETTSTANTYLAYLI